MISKCAWGVRVGIFLLLGACATHKEVKELRLVSFDDNVNKGRPVGEIEGDDCVFHVMGYWLGGEPTLSRALTNARKMKKTSLHEVVVASNDQNGETLRYLNNVRVDYKGFDYYLLGKRCVIVKGMGYR